MELTATTRKPASTRRSGTATREQLLEIAAQLFARRGLHGVTLAEIAGEAGMSGPAIYNHFESKNALFSEVVCAMYEGEIAVFAEVLDPLKSVSAGLDALLTRVPEIYRGDGVMQLLGQTAQLEAVRAPETFGAILQAVRRRDEVAIRLVERARRAGELPDSIDTEEMGSLLISLFIGALGNRSLRASELGQFVHSVETFRELLKMLRRNDVKARARAAKTGPELSKAFPKPSGSRATRGGVPTISHFKETNDE